MDILFAILVMLLAVGLSGIAVKVFSLPLPLLQISIGAFLAWLPFINLDVHVEPEMFFLLFIAPLLFIDGWHMPKREFFRLKGPIFLMAFGLVFFTVLGIGCLIHYMIPPIPWAASFALAAVLSPTDAVAVAAISGKTKMPATLKHILEGEALLNDASGLVCFKFAVAAALTGVFSLVDASVTFVFMAAGGVAVGIGIAWVFGWLQRHIIKLTGEDPSTQIVLALLVPFASFALAEHFHFSGILAAVAAGMKMSRVWLRFTDHVSTRIQAGAVFDMLGFVFNGIIFLMLGFELPAIVAHAIVYMHEHNEPLWHLAYYVLVISFALIALRFIWVWASLEITLYRDHRKGKERNHPGMRLLAATALAGVRGAITLAGVLSLPLVVPGGEAFPSRDLIIFLAAGVIICSLLAGSIGLPFMLRALRLPRETPLQKEERLARIAAAEAAIREVEQAQMKIAHPDDESDHARCAEIAAHIMTEYRRKIDVASGHEEETTALAQRATELEKSLMQVAVRAERNELYRLHTLHQINDATLRLILRELDGLETVLQGPKAHHH